MKRIVCIVIVISFFGGCTKNNYVDTGLSNGCHNGSLMNYMEMHPYDWDSTVVMVRHAGEDMVRLFEGLDSDHEEITFFGLTNHSIRRYLLQKNLQRVADLDIDWCRSILFQHVVDGKYYRKDIPSGKPGLYGTLGTGGMILTTLAKTKVWVYVVVQESGGIVENAAKPIYVNFLKSNGNYAVASGDIEPNNCIVHALDYNFTLGNEE